MGLLMFRPLVSFKVICSRESGAPEAWVPSSGFLVQVLRNRDSIGSIL